MKLLGRLEVENGCCQVVKHILPGRENLLFDGISRWETSEVTENERKLAKGYDCSLQDIGNHGRKLLGFIL